jgi:SAM-dependent methyltransferase
MIHMTSHGHALTHCLACNSTNLSRILDFGQQPLANSYVDKDHLSDVEYMAPLGLNYCVTCSHLQLPFAVNPDMMFKDYSYVSGTSQTLRDYFDWFARFSCEYYHQENYRDRLTVLDIACNDGSQLDSFKKLDHITMGVDPAENLWKTSTAKGHDVSMTYLNTDTVRYIMHQTEGYGVDIINAQNVFAHNADPVGFLRHCRDMMNDETLLFIQNSQADMIKNGEFDTIYHEHHSFWNLASTTMAASRANLNVIDRVRTPIHGTSDLFVLSKYTKRPSWNWNSLEMEYKEGLHSEKTYLAYAERAKKTIKGFSDMIGALQNNRATIVGYGAAAKGNTLLNAAKIDLDCIIDDNPLKQDKYTPGRHIPIVSQERFLASQWNTDSVIFVPLAWNFHDEIRAKIQKMRPNKHGKDMFIRYFPTLEMTP